MAAQVEVQPGEVGRSVAGGRLHLNPLTDSSNTNLIEIPAINQARLITSESNRPAPAAKPRLSPKPFAVERNPTIKPILAPKPQTKPRPESTRLPGHKPEPPSNPKPLQPVASGKSRLGSSNPNRPAPTSFKTSNKFNIGQTTKPIAQPFKPAPPFDPGVTSKPGPPVLEERQKPAASSYAKNLKNLQAAEWFGTTQKEDEKDQRAQGKGGTSITRAKSMGFLLDVGQETEKKERVQPEAPVQLRAQSRGFRARPVSAIFPDSPTNTETVVPAPRWTGRRPLSADLTSKFESVGLSLHRKSLKADTQANTAEKSPQLKREQDKIPPHRNIVAGNHALTDQSGSKAEEAAVKETVDDDDKRGASIKSRISLLLDLSSSLGPTSQGSEFPSPVQPATETESTLGVKKLIKQLTEDTTPTQSPVMKPSPKPRQLPLDRTKRFSSERSPDLISLSEAADRHEIIKDPQRRAEEPVVTPNDQKTFLDSKDSQEQLRKASTPEPPGAGSSGAVQTVRASLFENVVERHSVFMMDDGGSHSSPSPKRRDLEEDDGTLFVATYKEPASSSSPLQVRHAFDTVQAIEKNRAVSEIVPSAQWEDKAMTLRSKRLDGSRQVAEGTSPAQGQSVSSMTAEPQPRYLRVGALTKFSNSDPDQNAGLEKGTLKESQREGQERVLEQDDAAASPKRLKMLPTEEQSKPRATYFALTGQMQEPFFLGEAGKSIGDIDDHSSRSALSGMQGKSLPIRRNPSLEEAFGKTSQSQQQMGELMMKSHLSSRDVIELEKQRLKEKKEREEAEKIRQVALEQEMFRIRELEKDRHREVDLRSVLDDQREEEVLDAQKKRDLQKETERHMAKLKELEMEKQAHREFARMKELEMQREVERQRQKLFEKQKREMEEKQRALEMQKQTELEKQRLQEAEEKLKLEREKQWQLEREKRHEAERMQERERQRERERQKQREEERQRELDKERRLLEIQKEKQKMEEMEKLKEQERQQLLEIQKQKQREKERQQVIEYEKHRLREKKEREQAEKMKQMALEQEMLRIRELDKERERQKEMERERQKEIEREKQRQEQERQQLIELQKQKQREKERQQLIELENQRLREKREREEAEKIKQMALEQEMLRIREVEKERERQKELERERQKEIEREKQRVLEQQRQRELERERQRQLDMERQEMENQRLRQKEQEKEKKRLEDLERLKEMERQQLLEFEKQKQAERDRQQMMELEKQRSREKMEKHEAERMRQIAKQQEAERQRLKEKQRQAEQERLRQESAPMRPKVLDLDSVLRSEPLVKAPAQRSDPANRWKEPYKPAILDIDSFTSQTQHSPGKDLLPLSGIQGLDSDFGTRLQHTPERDVSWKAPPQTSGSFSSPVWTTTPQDPWELRPVEMSVDKSPTDPRKHDNKVSTESLLFRQDEPLWNPQRNWPTVQDDPFHSDPFSGTNAGTTNTPSGLSCSSSMEYAWLPRELQPQESRGAVHDQRRSQGSQELNRMRSRSVSRRSAPASSSAEGNLSRVRSRSAHRAQDRHSWVPQKQAGEEEGKDSETPVRDTDSQYGTWETGLRTDDSLTPATPSSESNLSPSPKKPTPPLTPGDAASPSEVNAPDGLPPSSSAESQPLAFPDAPTTLLDTSVLRSRAQLGKKRAPRTRPSRAARQTAALTEEETTEDWLYRDSTETKPKRKDDDSDSEEQARGAESSPAVASQPQRVALFPGMDPSALKAQLKKRGDSDNQVDGAAASPSQLSRSPKSPFLPRAARVLPPPGGKENGEENSPQWLKELKSKKRLSQYESES